MESENKQATKSKTSRGSDILLQAKDLKKVYSGRTVVNDVSLTIGDGEIVGLLGPNGAGKTTSFYMLTGLVPPTAGEVHYLEQKITHLPMHKRARLGMSYLPQDESIFRKLSVQDNLLAVLETQANYNRKQRKERCEELLERFSLTKIRKNLAITLSGGEKRRLSIARCLCSSPRLLMLDEPFAGVDPLAVGDIHEIVSTLRDTDNLSILITDHDVRATLRIVDHAYVMADGKMCIEGTADEIANDPIAKSTYLGEDFIL